jgi:hypothetical protein
MIEIQQAAEPLAPLHLSVLIRRFSRSPEQHIAKTLVVPFAVVVGEVLHDGPPEMPFPQRHDPVQAFAFYREHKSLGIGVQVRTSGGQEQRYMLAVRPLLIPFKRETTLNHPSSQPEVDGTNGRRPMRQLLAE